MIIPTEAVKANLVAEFVHEAVEAGMICPSCLGIHIRKIEDAIHLLSATRQFGIELQSCSCCEACREFQRGVDEVIEERQ